MPHLVVNCTFNPPVVKIMGATLHEVCASLLQRSPTHTKKTTTRNNKQHNATQETIHKLDQRMPAVTTTSVSPKKELPKFVYIQNPPHWHSDLGQHYCDQLGRSMIYLTMIECLEGEDWKLKVCFADQTGCNTHAHVFIHVRTTQHTHTTGHEHCHTPGQRQGHDQVLLLP